MKATELVALPILTVRQPWAQLIVCGAKDIENRDWPTKMRGRIAIHSSAKLDRQELWAACDLMRQFIPRFSSTIFKAEAHHYPLGSLLGTVEIVDCVTSSASPWFVGRYGFVLRDPIPLRVPIPCRGQLGFWKLPPKAADVITDAGI